MPDCTAEKIDRDISPLARWNEGENGSFSRRGKKKKKKKKWDRSLYLSCTLPVVVIGFVVGRQTQFLPQILKKRRDQLNGSVGRVRITGMPSTLLDRFVAVQDGMGERVSRRWQRRGPLEFGACRFD